jgi:uncharacterized protein (UPF0332 family)
VSDPRQELIEKMMSRAWEFQDMARQALEQKKFYFASINAYAAAFHGMKALLETKEISVSKHGRVIGEVNRLFVKTGKLHPSTTKLLDRLFAHRQKGYYSYVEEILEEDASRDVEDAEKLLHEFETILSDQLSES